jgi:hypothetical protein
MLTYFCIKTLVYAFEELKKVSGDSEHYILGKLIGKKY